MRSKYTIKEGKDYFIIEAENAKGTILRITVDDTSEHFTINAPDGVILIKPSVSNEIRILTDTR